MRLKPSCSVCKDYSKFIENIQLRILLQCYKRLTVYLKKSKISKKWASLQTGSASGVLVTSANSIYNQNQCPSNFKDLINEGVNLEDTYRYTFFEPPSLKNLNKSTNNSTKTNSTSSDNSSKLVQLNVKSVSKLLDKDDLAKSGQATIVRLTSNSTIVSNRPTNSANHLNNHQTNLNKNTLNQSSNSTASNLTATPTKSKHKVRKGCRCGLATMNPGKLTCCGQRCPCYVEGKPCFECKCRGCRNPNKSSNNNPNNSNNSIVNKTSPTYINTSSSITSNQIIATNTSNLLSPSSPNLQLNSLNQATLISPAPSRNLLSPSFLLSSSSTINTPSTALISNNSSNQMLRNTNSMFPTTGNKIVSISSPSTAILLGHNVDSSLILPFPSIDLSEENVIEDPSLHHQISDIITNENDEL